MQARLVAGGARLALETAPARVVARMTRIAGARAAAQRPRRRRIGARRRGSGHDGGGDDRQRVRAPRHGGDYGIVARVFDGEYLSALGLTLLSEAPIVLLGFRRAPRGRVWWVFVAVNLFTHGLLWAAWFHLPGDYFLRLIVCEFAVFAVEAAVYRLLLNVSWSRAAAVSAAANFVSLALGLVLRL